VKKIIEGGIAIASVSVFRLLSAIQKMGKNIVAATIQMNATRTFDTHAFLYLFPISFSLSPSSCQWRGQGKLLRC
jgi:cytochrome b561